jgi:hypothetical protein
MSAPDRASIATLRAHISKHINLLEQSRLDITAALSEDIPRLGTAGRTGHQM